MAHIIATVPGALKIDFVCDGGIAYHPIMEGLDESGIAVLTSPVSRVQI